MRNLNVALIVILFVYVLTGCSNKSKLDDASEYDDKVATLMKKMTLREKIGQMNQYSSFMNATGPVSKDDYTKKKYDHLKEGLVGSMLNVRGVDQVLRFQKIAVEETRLGIPLIFGFDVIHGYRTQSPIPLAEAASWDLEAIKKSAQVAATEAAAAGINWTFAPMVDIARDARWGRIMEGAGEDTYLGSLIAKARIEGFQGDDLSATNTIAACAKHFAAYGFAEAGRDYNTVDIGASTLYNIVLPPFKSAVDVGVCTFMNSFNVLNGVPATGNAFLQRDILKGKWGFKGYVVSDWESIKEMLAHGFVQDKQTAAIAALQAGCDMDMEAQIYIDKLEDLVKAGKVDEALIDDAVKRILTLKYELGLFDNPYKYCDANREKELIGAKVHHNAVLDMAKKSIVLLKNENNLLPLKKKGLKIALIGDLADDKYSPLGSWRLASDDEEAVSVVEGLKVYDNTVKFAQGVRLMDEEPEFFKETKINLTDRSGIAKAKNIAKKSDVVLMVLGEPGFLTGEGRSRTSLNLPGLQEELLKEVYGVNKNIVLILMNGRPLTIPWAAENVPAILETWHLGSQSGNAIAQVLYGDYNPSGKLPISFPRSVGQVPIYYNHYSTGRPTSPGNDVVFWSHYIDESNKPLYPFGYGLSYTTFEYKDFKVTNTYDTDKKVNVTVTITNTGELKGKEVAQLYIRDLAGSVVRPVKELKGFEMIELNPGESKTISFLLTDKELGFYDNDYNYVVEPGEFNVWVGGSSDAKLMKSFKIK